MSLCEPLYNAVPTRERVQLDMSIERLRGRHFIDGGGPPRDCRVCSKRGVQNVPHKSVYNSEKYIIYYSFTTLY